GVAGATRRPSGASGSRSRAASLMCRRRSSAVKSPRPSRGAQAPRGVGRRGRTSSSAPARRQQRSTIDLVPQYRSVTEERIVTREQYEHGYLERDGLVVRKRRYELIRELPDGRLLVRVAAKPEQPSP